MENTIIFDEIPKKVSPKIETLKPKNLEQTFQKKTDETSSDNFTQNMGIFSAIFSGVLMYFGVIPVLALFFGVLCFVTGVVAKIFVDRNTKYRELAKATKPFFVKSLFAGDTTVSQRANKLRKELDTAWVKNPFSPKPEVYELIREYGGQSEAQYLSYCAEYEARKTSKYHDTIREKNPKYYNAVILSQDGWRKDLLLGKLSINKLTDAQLYEYCFDFHIEWDDEDECMIEWEDRGLNRVDYEKQK